MMDRRQLLVGVAAAAVASSLPLPTASAVLAELRAIRAEMVTKDELAAFRTEMGAEIAGLLRAMDEQIVAIATKLLVEGAAMVVVP